MYILFPPKLGSTFFFNSSSFTLFFVLRILAPNLVHICFFNFYGLSHTTVFFTLFHCKSNDQRGADKERISNRDASNLPGAEIPPISSPLAGDGYGEGDVGRGRGRLTLTPLAATRYTTPRFFCKSGSNSTQLNSTPLQLRQAIGDYSLGVRIATRAAATSASSFRGYLQIATKTGYY